MNNLYSAEINDNRVLYFNHIHQNSAININSLSVQLHHILHKKLIILFLLS